MGYFVVYAPEDEDAPVVGGDEIASNSGYAAFLEWIDGLSDERFPTLYDLSEQGGTEDLKALAKELTRALREGDPPADVAEVVKRLLRAVKEAPAGAAARGVTDGTS